MLYVYSYIKILIYYAISYDYLAQICFARKHDKIFNIWFFLNTQHTAEISLSCKENNWTSSQVTCLLSLPATRRVDEHDPQNIIAHFKWQKVLSYSGRQWIPFPSTTHNHKFISLQEYKTRLLSGLFSIIILSKSPAEVLFTKKHRCNCQNGRGQENTFQLFLTTNLRPHPTSSKIHYCYRNCLPFSDPMYRFCEETEKADF